MAAAAPEDVGRPALLVGGEGEKRTLPAAAAYADAVNWQIGVSEFARKSQILGELCESLDRDPATLCRTHAPNFQLFESEREFARWRQDARRGRSSEEVYAYIRNRGALYGTTSAIEETIEAFIDAGCGGFMVFCNSLLQQTRCRCSPGFRPCTMHSEGCYIRHRLLSDHRGIHHRSDQALRAVARCTGDPVAALIGGPPLLRCASTPPAIPCGCSTPQLITSQPQTC